MTLPKAKSIARHLGLTLRQLRSGNYRVNFRDGNETTAYYTDNLEDALNNAVEMACNAILPNGVLKLKNPRSSSASERFAVFTASARSLPSLMYSIDEDRSGHWWGVSKVSLGGHQRPAIRGTGFRNIDPRADARRTAERGGLSLDGLRDAPPFAAKAPPCVPGAGPPAGRRSCA